ncbi:39S ribosomal protein L21, mitochondrial isoform X2 [Macrosteles quadrilineatus]|uniref:39S ribosomal protein L21, mitochondrial isoform X2 n=1 Tax=Macrosteles quadrilineatus TaxID=74068 RepID=UPI0023E0F2B3|nr:39S ribosomal protein L21, mitochondrial isoform X2 [Macrosteles quadrilineatus]
MAVSIARTRFCLSSLSSLKNKIGNVMPSLAYPQCTGIRSGLQDCIPAVSWVQRAFLRTNIKDSISQPLKQEEVKDTRDEDNCYTQETIALVNDQIARGEEGRLFAVIHVVGKQFIVTPEDIIIIHGPWAPTISDKITFEKVMLVGGSDFTLLGRPVLPPELVTVTGTVIDKDLSHVKTKFRFRKRKQFRRINFIRTPLTMVRINEVKIEGKVGERKDVEGLNQVFF